MKRVKKNDQVHEKISEVEIELTKKTTIKNKEGKVVKEVEQKTIIKKPVDKKRKEPLKTADNDVPQEEKITTKKATTPKAEKKTENGKKSAKK